MNKKLLIVLIGLFCCCGIACPQETAKSELQLRAETDDGKGNVPSARFHFIRAFEDYVKKGQIRAAVECGVKGTALYYKESYFQEAFDLLRRIDEHIEAATQNNATEKASLRYLTTRERFQMYMIMRRSAPAMEQLNTMETHASTASDEALVHDLLYNKTIYYYTFGQTAKGNATFKEMANKLTARKEYSKVDEVYQTLIANGRKSNNASLVAQSYSSYIAWKDSVEAIKHAEEIGLLQQQIADNEASIAEKDSSLTSRGAVIVGLSILAIALAAALIVGAAVLLRFVVLTRKQKKAIKLANENNALKARFISNISAQIEPTLRRLDSKLPEVKALLDFSNHIQTLSAIEATMGETVEQEDTQIPPFCEELMDKIRNKVKGGVTLTVNAPKMTAKLHREYVAHILQHLLENAAEYAPEGGRITLEFKKRSAHKHQFLVSDTGQGIPEEKRDDVFKPFLETHDLTTGDGLGLPICKQMALKMNGDLTIDTSFTKGTRFVLDLQS